MTSKYDTYTSPLAERNASPEMLRLWSPRHKFNTWRRIWLAVAEAQHEISASSPTVREGPGTTNAGGANTPKPSLTVGLPVGGPPVGGPPAGGLLVTKEQVEELRAVVERGITDAEMHAAEKYERELRHDVMAHVHALGDSCPKAKGIIHLGMTSQDVVCNADLLILEEATHLLLVKTVAVISTLATLAARHAHTPTLAFTHYQAAQPETVGRRFAGWASDIALTLQRLATHTNNFIDSTKPDTRPLYGASRSLRGATGTQASYLSLFDDSHDKVDQLSGAFIWRVWRWPLSNSDRSLQTLELRDRGRSWTSAYLTGQTYPRVIDTFILADLTSTASVLHKIATDIRLLCNRKEIDEPFESKQIGSSAMPYKRNPMRCERICGLTRFVMNLVGNAYDTAATQWLERTLDDSSNRRLSLPEAFLALDGALDLMHNVASGLIVHEAMVRKNLMAELPFMATENILMACVKLGGDRQQYHELIRQHAQAAGMRVKQEGLDNDLLDRLKHDKNFWSKDRGGPLAYDLDWDGVLDPMKYVGRSVEQTERFIKDVVEPLRAQYAGAIAKLGTSEPKV